MPKLQLLSVKMKLESSQNTFDREFNLLVAVERYFHLLAGLRPGLKMKKKFDGDTWKHQMSHQTF
jgi:hypothetical protein